MQDTGSNISRRIFIKLAGRAVGSAVAVEAAQLGLDLGKTAARIKPAQIKQGREVASVCPYCAVGCGQIITVKDGAIKDIQGNYDSPISAGTLCPKGAASYQLAVNPNRWTTAKYRAPGSDAWEDIPLDKAMGMIADRVRKTRESTWVKDTTVAGAVKPVNHTLDIFSLGGATIDNEWNYLHQKSMRALGIVAVENQARI